MPQTQLEDLSVPQLFNIMGNVLAVISQKAEQELAGNPKQAEIMEEINEVRAAVGSVIQTMEEGQGEMTQQEDTPSPPATPKEPAEST